MKEKILMHNDMSYEFKELELTKNDEKELSEHFNELLISFAKGFFFFIYIPYVIFTKLKGGLK